MTKRGQGMTPNQRRLYMMLYMREWRAARGAKPGANRDKPQRMQDRPTLQHESAAAAFLGDPPIGRRAIDQ